MKTEEISFEEDIKKALKTLREGGVILYPTDTVWGLGCDARNSEAVKRIFDIKKREDAKSMLVLTDNICSLERLVNDVPEIAYQIIETADNPITIIYEEARNVAPELISEDGSLGIRITHENYSNELCKRLKGPLVSTSANISGERTPAFFNEISDVIKSGVDYIVYYRRDDNTPKRPSNIIKVNNNGVFRIIR